MCIKQLKKNDQLGQTKQVRFIFVITTGIKIPFFVFAENDFIRLSVQGDRGFYGFVFRRFNLGFIGT